MRPSLRFPSVLPSVDFLLRHFLSHEHQQIAVCPTCTLKCQSASSLGCKSNQPIENPQRNSYQRTECAITEESERKVGATCCSDGSPSVRRACLRTLHRNRTLSIRLRWVQTRCDGETSFAAAIIVIGRADLDECACDARHQRENNNLSRRSPNPCHGSRSILRLLRMIIELPHTTAIDCDPTITPCRKSRAGIGTEVIVACFL
jgi:hypothetical protein